MTKKQSTKKKGKARRTLEDRARAIVASVKGYSDETRHAISNALAEDSSDLAELVRRAEMGDDILDARGPVTAARAARLVVSLFDRGAGVPDWLTDLIMRGLEAATERTGVKHWGATLEAGFDLRGLADLFAVTDTPKFSLEFEPKKDLPELISAVLRHPDTPANLCNAIGGAVDEWLMDDTDPVYLRLALANLAAVQKEIAENEAGEE